MSTPILVTMLACALWMEQQPEERPTIETAQVAQAQPSIPPLPPPVAPPAPRPVAPTPPPPAPPAATQPAPAPQPAATPPAPQPVAPAPAPVREEAPEDFVGPLPPGAQSAAEQITRLQRTIDNDQKYFERLKADLQDPDSDYRRAEAQFQAVDSKRNALNRDVQRLRAEGKRLDADRLLALNPHLEENWSLARDSFNLAILERQTIQEKIVALDQKIKQDRQVLDGMVNAKAEEDGLVGPPRPASLPDEDASLHTVVMPGSGGDNEDSSKPASKELTQAREDAKAKNEAAREASEKAKSIGERLEGLKQNIALERKLLDTARRKADQYQAMQANLDKNLKQKLIEGADKDTLAALNQQVDDAQKKFLDARADVTQATDRLNELQAQLSALQTEQMAALQEAERIGKEARAAEAKVAELQNPFTLHNILQWLLNHGVRILAIIIGMLLLSRTVRASSQGIVKVMAKSGQRGTQEERENRAQTLVGVFRNTTAIVIICGGTLMVFDEVGIPIVPLMGGAAVLGLAVAFGAQNLIKDYFSGFMVLLEDQYGINDVVKIGAISGMVEKITLRVTVLRDLEGTVHFIPHGSITTVSNKTHGWSRAFFEIRVDYAEDCDEVMRVLMDLGRELRKDPRYSRLILDEPEMLGVDALGESAYVIKFYMKTKPLQQWGVRREMLRRIKKKFDELGIDKRGEGRKGKAA